MADSSFQSILLRIITSYLIKCEIVPFIVICDIIDFILRLRQTSNNEYFLKIYRI